LKWQAKRKVNRPTKPTNPTMLNPSKSAFPNNNNKTTNNKK